MDDLQHACTEPSDLDKMVTLIIEDAPGAPEKDHVKMVMGYYKGKVNPKTVVDKIREIRKELRL